MDADSNVVKLNRDLTGIEEYMKTSMQPSKFRSDFIDILVVAVVAAL